MSWRFHITGGLRRGVSLAWQAVGDHPVDVIEVTGMFAHLEAKWEEPGLARWMSDIARFARLILFDRRGVGLSDRIAGDVAPTMEQLVADVEAVPDAAARAKPSWPAGRRRDKLIARAL